MARILLMEDDVLQRAHLSGILEENGHDVVACPNATDAIRAARDEAFDLVVTDIIVQVEGRSQPDGGISLIGHLRRVGSESATAKTVPIIAVTGTYRNPGMGSILTTAIQIGATDELKKPVHAAELLLMVDDLLQEAAQDPPKA